MEIIKEKLEALGFDYKLADGHKFWQIIEKGCLLIQNNGYQNEWFICIEKDHDYSEASKPLTLQDIIDLDRILNKS